MAKALLGASFDTLNADASVSSCVADARQADTASTEDRVNIDVGDVVQLRSGGPDMTVEDVPDTTQIACFWFVQKDLRRETFPALALDKIDR